jgi:hypothetical protein
MTTSMSDDNIPHGLEGYRRYKCTCVVCRGANTQYQRARRAAKASNVRPLLQLRQAKPVVESEDEVMGINEQGVITVCGNNPIAAQRPDLVAQARTLAQFMDNPKLQKDYPTCSRQLSNLMDKLCPVSKTKSKGRLVAIQKMTNRRSPQGD